MKAEDIVNPTDRVLSFLAYICALEKELGCSGLTIIVGNNERATNLYR